MWGLSTREEILLTARFVTGGVFAVTLYLLVFGPPLFLGLLSVALLWFVYFGYAISGVVLLHFIIFEWEEALAKRGSHLSKRFPKYLEYAYTVIVAASLVQIFVFAPRMADYVTWVQGDEHYVGNQIKRVAQSYLKNECQHRSTLKYIDYTAYFTVEYCSKLTKIINAQDVTKYVLKSAITDPAFNMEVEYDIFTGTPVEPPDDEIRKLVNRFKIVHEYISLKGSSNSTGNNRLAWVGMLLLPIGIALRVVKTSVELFVPLQ